jgi:hypothetical protein
MKVWVLRTTLTEEKRPQEAVSISLYSSEEQGLYEFENFQMIEDHPDKESIVEELKTDGAVYIDNDTIYFELFEYELDSGVPA